MDNQDLTRALRGFLDHIVAVAREKIGARKQFDALGKWVETSVSDVRERAGDLSSALTELSTGIDMPHPIVERLTTELTIIPTLLCGKKTRKQSDAALHRVGIALESLQSILDKGLDGRLGLPFFAILQMLREAVAVVRTIPGKRGPKGRQ